MERKTSLDNCLIHRSSVLFQAIWIIAMFMLLGGVMNLFRIYVLKTLGIDLFLQIIMPIFLGLFFFLISAAGHPNGIVWAFTSSIIASAALGSMMLGAFAALEIILSVFTSLKAWCILMANMVVLVLSVIVLKGRGIWGRE